MKGRMMEGPFSQEYFESESPAAIKKPLIIISGFLGAGKTTLIRTLLTGLSRLGVMADVILNDIANAELDAESIDEEQTSSVIPLSASCACCESLDELMVLCKTAAEGKGDLLLIELNGTADPLVLAENFSLLKDDLLFHPILQVSVIDVRHWGQRGTLNPLERRQMEGAGMHLLAHTDNVSGGCVQAVASEISKDYPYSSEVTDAQLIDALLGAVREPSKSPHQIDYGERVSRQQEECGERNADAVHLLSHQVESCQISLPSKVRRIAIERLLGRLPAAVLRAKALVKTVEDPGMRWLFQRSGSQVSPSPTPMNDITTLSSSLLCVGMGLDKEVIRGLVLEEFGSANCIG